MNEGDELRKSFLRIGRELVFNLPRVSSLGVTGHPKASP